jgi:hypothetical protein
MSPHRRFTDDDGLLWQAWDVTPSWGERRTHQRRQRNEGPPPHTGERRIADRRKHRGIRIGLTPALAGGWLAFESEGIRRRIAPIPEGWDALSDDELRALWRAAEKIEGRRRRLIE